MSEWLKTIKEISLEQVPVTEPERQYYFMDLLKGWMAEQVAAKGRKLTYHIQTFGCQMNSRIPKSLQVF